MDLILMQLAMENHLRGLHEQLPRPDTEQLTRSCRASRRRHRRPGPSSTPLPSRSSNRRPDPTPERVLT